MKIEAIETNEKYCATMDDNGEVKILTKEKDANSFQEIIDLENEIESLIKKREKMEKEQLSKSSKIAAYLIIYIILFLFGYLGLVLFKTTNKFIGHVLMFLSGYYAIRTPSYISKLIKMDKKELVKLDERLEELNEQLITLKSNSKLKEEILVKSTNNREFVQEVNEKINENSDYTESAKVRALKLLRYELVNYVQDKGEEVDKPRQLVLKNINIE